MLYRLAETGRAVLYEVDGERICQLLKFKDHQKINHPGESKLPSTPENLGHPYGWLQRPAGDPPEGPGKSFLARAKRK